MKKLTLTAALGAACLGLAACGDGGGDNMSGANAASEGDDNSAAAGAAEGNGQGNAAAGNSAAAAFPQGARIVEENGVTYRVDRDGTRVRLGANDSRIVVENGVRYRVDPGGARVRIDPRGGVIDVDTPDVDVDLPDVDVGINNKGNPDIDVGDRDKDGGR
jgi:hypothetical protein